MPSCVVIGCKHHSSRFSKKDGVTYHRFPRHPARYEVWCRIIRLQRGQPHFIPHKNTRICSAHFSDNDVECSKSGIRKLKPSAIPRVEVPNCDSSQSQQLCKLVNSQFDARVPEAGEANESRGRGRQHVGYRCNLCRKHIFGFLYACVECANFDMCSACEARAQHASHYVLRVPGNKQHVEVQAVLENIRNVLLKRGVNSSWEPEVKLEQPEQLTEQDPLDAPSSDDDDDEEDCSEDSDQDDKSKDESTALAKQSRAMEHSAMQVPVIVTVKAEPPHEGTRETSHTVKAECEREPARRRRTSAGSDGPRLKASHTDAGAGEGGKGGDSRGFEVFTHQHKVPRLAPKGPLPPDEPSKTLRSRPAQYQALRSKFNQSSVLARNLPPPAVAMASPDPQTSSNNQQIPILDLNRPTPSLLDHKPYETLTLHQKTESTDPRPQT